MILDLEFEEKTTNLDVIPNEQSKAIDVDFKNLQTTGGGTGGTGENGATFYPSVSADGVISWTNDKGLENPPSVNIKGEDGEDGEDGHTPVITATPTTDGYWIAVDGEDICFIRNGSDGNDGIGIYSIERTNGTGAAGTVDTYTITFTDGRTEIFTVYNGKDGEKGDKGDKGKTAYEYAQDGGFAGTEEEFAEKLAKDYSAEINDIREEVADLSNTEDKVEYIVPTFTQKAYVSISGTVVAQSSEYAYTEKISVKEGQIIRSIVVSTSTGGEDKYLNFTTITAYVDGVVNSSLGVNGVGNFVYDYIVPKSVTEIVVSAKFFNSAYSNQRVEITTPATKSLISLGFVRNDYSFSLPNKFCLRSGQTAEIYLRNITNPNYLVRLGNYTNATTIRATDDCVKVTGNSVADKPISYVVYDNHFNSIEEGEMTLSILGTAPASQKMLLIGDSFIATSGGYFGSCLRDLFTADGNTLTLVGTQGTSPKNHEGYSGKKYTDFSNGFSGSPFGESGFDFSSYMSAQGYSGLNSVYIQLGTNDVSATNPNQDLSGVIAAMKTIVSSIQSYSSSIKIYVGMTVMPNLDSVTFANTYNGTGFNWIMKQNMLRLNAFIIKEYGESSSVKLVANNCILDNSVDILDNVHPTNAGFAKMARQLYYTMMS